MKRILMMALAVILVVSLAACKDNNVSNGNTTENATGDVATESGVENSSTTEVFAVADEETVKFLLSEFSEEITGLSDDVYDYFFNITAVTFNGKPASKAEAYAIGTDEVQGIFFIVDDVCYKYDELQDKYFELTDKKADEIKEDIKVVEETEAQTTAKADDTTKVETTVRTEADIVDENTKVLVSRYEKYDLSKIGITKPISEYEFQATAKSATAVDGETVYIIYLLENGVYTEFTFAVGPDKDYYLDNATGEYKPLS